MAPRLCSKEDRGHKCTWMAGHVSSGMHYCGADDYYWLAWHNGEKRGATEDCKGATK